MLISIFLIIIISTSLTVPTQPSPRFHVEAWLLSRIVKLIFALCLKYTSRGSYGILFYAEKNDCLLHPCKNDGTCVQTSSSYRCLCGPGYIGKNCGGE